VSSGRCSGIIASGLPGFSKKREAHHYMERAVDLMRDLVLERQTDLSDVFFVNRTTIPWPPEPLRGLTAKAIVGYMHIEDRMCDAKKKVVA